MGHGAKRVRPARTGTGWIEALALFVAASALALIGVPSWRSHDARTAEERCRDDLRILREELIEAARALRDRLHSDTLPRTFLGPGDVPVFDPPEPSPRAALPAFVAIARERASSASPTVGPDPWNRAYVLRIHCEERRVRDVWLLSAGPDGVLETEAFETAPRGDDLGFVLFDPP